jgi:nitrogen-specific signal transduction histidine kinase
MSESISSGQLHLKAAALLVCDAAGRVKAVSSGTAAEAIGTDVARKHYAEVFGRDSNITKWLTDHFELARKQGDYSVEANVQNGDAPLSVRLESLKTDDEFYGFAVHLNPADSRDQVLKLQEGDAIVTRQEWHDVKNHLGGLKLYATFLKRKLAMNEDQQIVEKMLQGIDVLIEHLAKIRRGESQ